MCAFTERGLRRPIYVRDVSHILEKSHGICVEQSPLAETSTKSGPMEGQLVCCADLLVFHGQLEIVL